MEHDKPKSATRDEFDLIAHYFSHVGKPAVAEVLLGVGDDAALITCPTNDMAIAVDTLNQGTHFFNDDPPESIAHKALMVNLSDLSAMGAVPFGFLLSLTLPHVETDWLERFSSTLNQLAHDHHVQLVGGDTTSGPLSVSITALGNVHAAHALKRSAARVGDDIYLSGEIGAAAYYVYARAQGLTISEHAKHAYEYPNPPIALGAKLGGLAHAAIDVSDGLIADLSHILEASQVGATLEKAAIPIAKEWGVLPVDEGFTRAVTGGDDYVLCFTAPQTARGLLEILAPSMNMTFHRVGEITEGRGLLLDGQPWDGPTGYRHFSDSRPL